jgi:hypothetical protein
MIDETKKYRYMLDIFRNFKNFCIKRKWPYSVLNEKKFKNKNAENWR